MEGIPNQGATCWLGSLVQCLRVVKEWPVSSDDPFTREFLKLMHGSNDLGPILSELSMDLGPNDSQEALFFILDKLGDKDFEGSEKQIVVTPKGRSESIVPCTIWFHPKKEWELLTEYDGHNVCMMTRILEKVPHVLVSDHVEEEYMGKTICAIIHWGMGHYVASVKTRTGDWVLANDHSITRITPIFKGYFAFYR